MGYVWFKCGTSQVIPCPSRIVGYIVPSRCQRSHCSCFALTSSCSSEVRTFRVSYVLPSDNAISLCTIRTACMELRVCFMCCSGRAFDDGCCHGVDHPHNDIRLCLHNDPDTKVNYRVRRRHLRITNRPLVVGVPQTGALCPTKSVYCLRNHP